MNCDVLSIQCGAHEKRDALCDNLLLDQSLYMYYNNYTLRDGESASKFSGEQLSIIKKSPINLLASSISYYKVQSSTYFVSHNLKFFALKELQIPGRSSDFSQFRLGATCT